MNRDPWSNEQLKFDRRLEGYYPDHASADRIAHWGGVLVLLVVLIWGVLAWL